MELTGLQTQPQTTTLQGAAGADAALQTSSSGSSASAPVLNGEGVRIRSCTDFEKLLAEMKADRKDVLRQSVATQFSASLAMLTGRYENLSAVQQSALNDVAAATDALSQATAAAGQAQANYDASVIVLATETAKLEAMVEASVTTSEDRVEEQYAEEEIAKQREAVAAQERVVAENLAALNEANVDRAKAEETMKTAVNALDSLCKGIVVEACVISCRLLSAAAAERGDSAGESKVSEIIEAIGEYADKLQEMQDEELEETVAKIVPDLVYLVTANYTIAPGDLPQYERRV